MDFPEASQIPAAAVTHISIFCFIFWLKTCDIQRPDRVDTKWQLGGGGRGSLGALTCEYLTSDVRVSGPEVSINSVIFKLSTKYFMSKSSFPPISSETTFHLHPVDMTSVIITIEFFAGKSMIALHTINAEVSVFTFFQMEAS